MRARSIEKTATQTARSAGTMRRRRSRRRTGHLRKSRSLTPRRMTRSLQVKQAWPGSRARYLYIGVMYTN
jgi:hypothetical protein